MNLNPNLKSSIACDNKTYLGGIQVQNMIFLDCLTMIALDFYVRSSSCFKFDLFIFQKDQKTCAS
jgi:hypothetical protein